MKKFGLLLLLCGCIRGRGVYEGKLVDVAWEGLIFKSCEIRQVTNVATKGNQDNASSISEEDCNALSKLIGKSVSINYSHTFFEPGYILGTDTRYRIDSFKEAK